MTQMVARLDDMGTPIWVALLVLSFVIFWPVGLALLAFLLTSGRLGSHRGQRCGGWARRRTRSVPHHWRHESGNSAFDEYREQTLTRLEEEQSEFQDFLKQLRMAKDRTEFDRFMADRSARASAEEDDSTDDDDPRDEGPDGEQDARPPANA
ncbi:MAG: DUF2852 domain-containing protein [Polyangiales bacterium]